MRILFDQSTPVPLKEHLPGHSVATAYEKGWSTLRNGELLAVAEAQFDVLVTTDRNLRFHGAQARDRRPAHDQLASFAAYSREDFRIRGCRNAGNHQRVSTGMIRDDQELAATRDRVAKLERMQGEILDYLVRASPGAKRTTTA